MVRPGMHVMVGPVTSLVRPLPIVGPSGERFVSLHLEHSTGFTEVAMPVDFGRALAKALLRECTGIEIATTPPPRKARRA